MRAAASLIATVLLLSGLGSRAAAEPSEPERLYNEGQSAYDARRYDVALARWQRSYELSKLPALLFNIGQAYRLRGATGDCARAVESYQKFLQLDPASPQRATAEGFLRELRGCGAGPPPPEATPAPPAAAILPPPEGTSISAPMPPPPDPGVKKRLIGMAIIGGGALITTAGIVFGLQARSIGKDVSDACENGCVWTSVAPLDAQGRSAERKQWILLGVGATTIVAGGVFYYLGWRQHPSRRLAVVPRDGGAVLAWSGRW